MLDQPIATVTPCPPPSTAGSCWSLGLERLPLPQGVEGVFDLSPGGAHRTCPRTKLQGWGDAWTAEQWHKLDRCQVQEPLRFPRSDDVKEG